MSFINFLYKLAQIKGLTSVEYEALYNFLVFIGVIIIVLVMVYVLIGREPEEED
ncbi:MAG: hypothetical protein ACTSPY_03460 [Candidatus Helarchaeota archaeon]